jgi:hypothetical protein
MKNNKKHEARESKKHEMREDKGLMKGDYAKMEAMMHGKKSKAGAKKSNYKGR